MFVLHLILAAGSLSTLISGAPVPSFHSGSITQLSTIHLSEEKRSTGTYLTTFGGTGDVSDGWPSQDQWVSSLDTMFSDNNAILKSSCTQWGVPNNSDEEISDLAASIKSVSASTGVDARFIFAITMQESNGCVRAPTTNYGVRNPGLMQDHDGTGTCNDGTVSNPCPASAITQMIQDGTAGTAAGDGLKQCLALSGATDVSQYYKAARIYNSGSIDSSKNLGAGIATHCYASDIANRLLGWSAGPSACDSASVGSLSGTTGFIPDTGSSESVTIATTAPAATPTEAEVVVASTPAVVAGGAFAEITPTGAKEIDTPLPSSTPEPTPIPTPTPTPEITPEPTTTAAPVVVPDPSPSPVVASTIIVIPTPASAPETSSTPISTPTPSPAPASTPTPSNSGAVTPGSACAPEGLWNCIGGTAFQQCASGVWSVVQDLAQGMQCKEGQSKVFGVSAIGSRSLSGRRR